jgi:transcriptional regulator with XRE-family HTH domain
MHEQTRRVIGERLRQARLAADLTQQDVATDFLRSRQAVSSWEAGRTLPTVLELLELAILYGVSTDRLLIGSDDSDVETVRVLAQVRRNPKPDFEPSSF